MEHKDRIDIAVWVLDGEASSFIGDLNNGDYPTDMEDLY